MKETVEEKIQRIMEKAKQGKETPKDGKPEKKYRFPNSLSEQIKTAEQGRMFMLLLNSL